MTESTGVGGINGVLLWTAAERYDALAAFYRDTLGFPVRSERPGHLAFEWPNGMRLTIGIHGDVHGPSTEPNRVMVNFAVVDIHFSAGQLVRRGVTFVRPPSQEPWGGWIATFVDPDGNLVQLLQSAP